MKYSTVTNPTYANAEHTKINCWVKFDAFPNPLPFTASPDDVEEHGREIYARAIQGDFGAIVDYVSP